MNKQKKILILIQSGYSARNFILSGFLKNPDLEFTFWSDQDYIKQYNIQNKYINLPEYDYSWKANFIQKIKSKAEIFLNVKKTKDKNYLHYLIGIYKTKSLRIKLKNKLADIIAIFFATDKGIQAIDTPFYNAIRKTNYYKSCIQQLKELNPDVVFCTHQRASGAIAPVLAARDLGVKTACFIHSWDNIPKGVQLVKADNYFVWSDYMKEEMEFYYPFIDSSSIKVTGTPQFTMYFDKQFEQTRELFFKQFNLDPVKKYILFTGNDKTTSPNDPIYLAEICKAVLKINEHRNNEYRVLFRPNPVDRNSDFDITLKIYSNVLTELKPEWFGSEDFFWNKGGPSMNDISLLTNSIIHSELIVNVGSTIAIDAAILNKPTCWINFDVESDYNWSVKRVYQFIHFKILKDIQPIFWINELKHIEKALDEALENKNKTLSDRQKLIERVVKLPIEDTNKRMWIFLNLLDEV
tara:strand:+ start:11631 stop:13028 length:1398 start_codon:yes stop_codon:yes gene_type:complete